MSEQNDKILAEKSIYVVPLKREHLLLYAPLADSVLLVTQQEADRIATAISSPGKADDESRTIVDTLCDVVPVKDRDGQIHDEKDFINLSILPNNICNFTCSYCYSAKGRSSQQLTTQLAYRAIDFLLSPERNNAPLLTVSIFGGGEPLLSWQKVVKPTIDYLYQEAGKLGRRVVTTLITNGSLIPDGFIETCLSHGIDLVCSYEILEDVQNSQRKHFELVSRHIETLIQNDVVPAINSVVTELNVDRQVEMIETLHRRFPAIRYVAFEPVIDLSIADRTLFYNRFTYGFIRAEQLARNYGIKLTCSVLRNVDVTVDRYCPGEFALCADGSLSICPCVSSPVETNYSKYLYGHVDETGVYIDQARLQQLLNMNVYAQSWCRDCFAKWNCGGGCINNTVNNGWKQDPSYCRFVRHFLRYMLLKRLDEVYKEDYNENLQDIIGDYEYLIQE